MGSEDFKLHIGNNSIERILRRSYDDLGAFRIQDPAHPARIAFAAGASWFMTLFGWDSLWASEMELPVNPRWYQAPCRRWRPSEQRGGTLERGGRGKFLHELTLGISGGLHRVENLSTRHRKDILRHLQELREQRYALLESELEEELFVIGCLVRESAGALVGILTANGQPSG